jgi:hypothetical protein
VADTSANRVIFPPLAKPEAGEHQIEGEGNEERDHLGNGDRHAEFEKAALQRAQNGKSAEAALLERQGQCRLCCREKPWRGSLPIMKWRVIFSRTSITLPIKMPIESVTNISPIVFSAKAERLSDGESVYDRDWQHQVVDLL